MPLTLLEAKNALSAYVDNGVCSSDERVVLKINEAQRRLYSHRAWLGVLAKYSVPVLNSVFVLPQASKDITTVSGFGLESALKICASSSPLYFVTNGVEAFIGGTNDIVRVSIVDNSPNSRTYKVEDSGIAKVEVTGKLNLVQAIDDDDLLLIDDLDALKLMILAIYREENNQLEMAQALEAKAIERLTIKTDRAIEAARRLNYQTQITSEVNGTMGQYRARLALDLEDGIKYNEGELTHLLNRAEEALFGIGRWVGTIASLKVSAAQGEVVLPTEVGTVLAVSTEKSPTPVYTRYYDFHENGPGFQDPDTNGFNLMIDRGETFVNGEYRRKYYARTGDENGCFDILYKKRWRPKSRNADKMDIRNYQALKEMAMSIKLILTNPELAGNLQNRAVLYLVKELEESRGGAKQTINVESKAFAFSEIPSLV